VLKLGRLRGDLMSRLGQGSIGKNSPTIAVYYPGAFI